MQNATIDRRSCPKAAAGRNHRRAFALFALLPFLAVSCSEEPQASKTAAAAARPQVSVTVLHPQNVAVTAELPGRTAASLVAEVRPQVTGIIRARNFREGSEVKEGDVLYEIDPATYQAAYDTEVAAVQKAEGALPSAQSKVDRYKSLAQQNAVSAQDYDDATSTLAQAQADLASARAALETARINLDYTKIRAPIDGRIDESSVTVGALVQAAQTTALATINSLDPINVDVTQSSTNLLKFRRAVEEDRLKMSGDNVAVRLILEDGSTYAQNGTLEFTSASVDKTVGTFTVRATFPNPDRLLLPGMYVRAIIEEGVAQNSFLVPQRAVTRNAKGEATAMFVDADGKVAQRILPVQQSVGNSWLVSDDIADGDRVVVEGLQQIKDGQGVTATEVILDDATGMIKQSDAGTANPADQAALSPDRK
ncbi:efflux RND transporter periplasmic adaptor subunit [Rhizobiaceae bacterium BDR2-2]|uniref:Efflux RND transporter periplasmic adaptor subunit n=1 Tax=Ectorhizobium quercum TaxID=2965071 RepID=A0AAE3MXG1_9HYPH|nr:efflux RND transporter periplasmic adaptor subunit [Ectorhizobium quercum]MCX8996754.1 efflux RND transporter periplasmic adaptor subunit [Ectorhizobium quercum]